jgi:hypothetical protein
MLLARNQTAVQNCLSTHGGGSCQACWMDCVSILTQLCCCRCCCLAGCCVPCCACCSDKVRDQLISMWDRKKMGDMPKLLKDAAALAAAERAAPAAAPRAQQPSKPRSRASPEGTGGPSFDGSESDSSMDSAESEKRAAHRRQQQQQRKRAVAAVSGGVPGRPPKRPVTSSSSGQEGAHRPRDHPQSTKGLHASGVSAGLPTWGHPGQPLSQKPRTAGRGPPGMRRPGSCSHPPLELPAMPRASRCVIAVDRVQVNCLRGVQMQANRSQAQDRPCSASKLPYA